jgi:hypothetical protein
MNPMAGGNSSRMFTALIGILLAGGSVLAMAWDWVRHPEV